MPMIERNSGMLVSRCPRASHQPATTNQMMLPISEPAPAPGLSTVVRPNGQTYHPRRLADLPDVAALRKLRERLPQLEKSSAEIIREMRDEGY